jgi:pyruvate kinase
VCTIGPASRHPDVFRALADAGMDAARLNFSHTPHEAAVPVIALARDVARETGRPLALIADLQGPRIRVADLNDAIEVVPGRRYTLVHESDAPDDGTDAIIPTTYAGLATDLEPGKRVLLADGALELVVREVDRDRNVVIAEAVVGGTLTSQKGINLPDVEVQAPTLTEKDHADLKFAETQRVDYVALSFVRRPGDVESVKRELESEVPVIAKIEKDQALQNLEPILRECDGVMVARGDLGVELPYEEVPIAQKRIIREAQARARPVITATQMLESMTSNPRPSRAEVSDVANALLDGTDAVMLSAETAIGEYPVEAVKAMVRIINRTEREVAPRVVRDSDIGLVPVQHSAAGAIAAATLQAVRRLGSPFIGVFTRSGFTARLVSAQRPTVPILAVTDQWRTYNQLALVWAVRPILFRGEVEYEQMLRRLREDALESGIGVRGQQFVVTAGVPFNLVGTTNMLRIEEL